MRDYCIEMSLWQGRGGAILCRLVFSVEVDLWHSRCSPTSQPLARSSSTLADEKPGQACGRTVRIARRRLRLQSAAARGRLMLSNDLRSAATANSAPTSAAASIRTAPNR